MHKVFKRSAVFAAVLMSAQAFAAEPGWYAGVSVGQSQTSDWISKNDVLTGLDEAATELGVVDFVGDVSASSDDSDTSFKLFGGYQFNNWFAAELSYADFGENTAKATASGDIDVGGGFFPGSLSVGAKGESSAFLADAVGRFEAASWVTLFAKAGLYRAETELKVTITPADAGGAYPFSDSIKDSNVGAHFGVGADFNVSKHVVIRAEWERLAKVELEDSEVDIDNFSVSAIYKF